MSKMSDLSVRRVSCSLEDEQGGGTIMDLAWFVLLVGICGLAIFMLDEFRIHGAPQAATGASAQAAFGDFPLVITENGAPATVTAIAYARTKTPTDQSDDISAMDSVGVGEWAHPRHDPRLPVSVY